ncbi:MAG: permease prefix domain 1-containing protein [Phycisphaerales bacterium]
MIQTTSDATKTAVKPVRRGDAIEQWLAMFARFLRLPREQTSAIRDELDSHMRERVRDLMLEGLSEDEGMRRAIDELGEAAELAAHFRAAHKPARRLAMSIAAIGVAAGAAVISVVALTNSQPPQSKPETVDVQVVSKVEPTSRPLVHAEPVERLDPKAFPDDLEVEFATKLDPRSVGKGVPMLRDIPIVGSMFVPAQGARGEQIDLAPCSPGLTSISRRPRCATWRS